MATYYVINSEDDNTSGPSFKTLAPARARLEEERIAGRSARLVRWDAGRTSPTEIARVNSPVAHRSSEPLPLVQAFLVCRAVYRDHRTNEFLLVAPFDILTLPSRRTQNHYGRLIVSCGWKL